MSLSRFSLVLAAAPALAQVPDLPASFVSFDSGAFDTAAGEPVLAPALRDDGGERVLVKLPGPVTAAQAAELRARARVYCYVPNHAFLVRPHGDDARDLGNRLGASFVGAYHPAYKIGAAVSALTGEEPGLHIVMVSVFPDGDLATVAARLRQLGALGIVGQGRGGQFDRIRLLMPAAEVVRLREEIARIRDVFWIDLEPRLSLLNDTTIWVGQSGTSGGQATPVFARGIYGQGQIVGIIDTGIDPDMCYFFDAARGLPPTNLCNGGTTVDLQQRKVIAVDFLWSAECSGGVGNGEWDTQDHGTHVAGTVGGDRGTPLTHDPADGMAPGAKLVIQDGGYAVDSCGDIPGIGCPFVSIYPFFQQAYTQGARLHSNSYGDNEDAPVQNDYTAASEDVDQFMWDHKDFLLFFAAGNSGPFNDSVGSPSTAKSCVSVGATSRGSGANNLAFFSSLGYTDDGRFKPEVTNPGENIESADNDGNAASNNCGIQPMSGTSMATPGAAGLGALVRQYFTDGFYPTGAAVPADAFTPSAALVRAALVNSGFDMTGFLAGSFPGRAQGWGRILLDDVLYFPGDARKLWVTDDAGFPTGSSARKDFPVEVLSTTQALEVTLAWTDYPSTPAVTPHLVNDLDLTVTAPNGTTIWRGNVFSGRQSVTGGSADRRNTLEVVLLKSPQTGTYTVSVQAFTVPNGPQPFALVVTGNVQVTAPPPTGEDVVVGQGLGQPNANQVKAYTGAGTATAVDFPAYGAGQWGVNVASGNVDAAGDAEILTGPGPGPQFGPQVRGWDRAGTAMAKINHYAYGTLRYGVNVASGSTDGDAPAEIVTGAGPGTVFGPHVRGWNYDGNAIASIAGINIFAYGTLRYGVNVAEGNVDGDAFTEILTGAGPSPAFGATVRGWNVDGGSTTAMAGINFLAFALTGHGVNVAGGSVDAEPAAEIAATPGPGPSHPSRFLGFDYGGTVTPLSGFDVTPFTTLYGGRVGLGDVDGAGGQDLLAGAGRDPAASSTVAPYLYTGSALTPIASSFVPFGTSGYGVNVEGADLGY